MRVEHRRETLCEPQVDSARQRQTERAIAVETHMPGKLEIGVGAAQRCLLDCHLIVAILETEWTFVLQLYKAIIEHNAREIRIHAQRL